MKKVLIIALLLGLCAVLCGSAGAEGQEPSAQEPAEWTVLLYVCGSDLESTYGYATENLRDMGKLVYPASALSVFYAINGIEKDFQSMQPQGKVNVLIQTGGSKSWGKVPGMEIRADAIQRWQFECFPPGDERSSWSANAYYLLDTLPQADMAAPETLTDFIRWGVATCPARKTALVLWGHGGGAKTGLFLDENFQNDILYLYELKQALADADVMLETIVIDACLMASVETAWAVKDHARWMVASEEIVPGQGTAIDIWLKEMYTRPSCDGRELGRFICDTSLVKYANRSDEQFKSILTWSVTDLSKVDRLIECLIGYFQDLVDIYKEIPSYFQPCAHSLLRAEEYGNGREEMHDLSSLFYSSDALLTMNISRRNEIMNALSDAIVYSVRGPGRSEAMGLSFCYPVGLRANELDHYAKNAPFPEYLAFLDAVSDWTAPDWVYERTERLPALETVQALQLTAERIVTEEGIPGVAPDNLLSNLTGVYYRLYRLNEQTGQVVSLGRTVCVVDLDLEEGVYRHFANEPWIWPCIDGVPCCMQLVREKVREDRTEHLYNIPVQIGVDAGMLRCGNIEVTKADEAELHTFTVYGLWKGYDENSTMLNRSVSSLAKKAGQDYVLLYPIDATGRSGRTMYESSRKMTMYRTLIVEEKPLPPGTYYLEYEIDDMFEHPYVLERLEMRWDGEKAVWPGIENWKGATKLNFGKE